MAICPQCNRLSEYVDSREVLGALPGMIYLCRFCDAYAPEWKATGKSTTYGKIVSRQVQDARIKLKKVFDPIIEAKMKKENISYALAEIYAHKWLSEELKIDQCECHVMMLDERQSRLAATICQPIADKLRSANENATTTYSASNSETGYR